MCRKEGGRENHFFHTVSRCFDRAWVAQRSKDKAKAAMEGIVGAGGLTEKYNCMIFNLYRASRTCVLSAEKIGDDLSSSDGFRSAVDGIF